MKNKIEQYARGNFVYEHPEIILSETEIRFLVEANKKYSGTVTITNEKKLPMKGIVYSSSRLIRVQEQQFVGKENLLHFEVDGKDLEVGEVIEGTIDIVSDCGEASIHLCGKVTTPTFSSAYGPIGTMNDLVEYAKSDWAGALKVFEEPEFCDSFLLEGVVEREIYDHLMKGQSKSQAFEEFLIAIHRKQPISLTLSANSFAYEAVNEPLLDKIILTKDLWGYTEIRVDADCEFIQLEPKILSTDNFLGNQYSLEFQINPNKLTRGTNVGHITIETMTQSFEVRVTCNQPVPITQEMINRRKMKEYRARLVELYLGFRLRKIPLEQYIRESGELVNSSLAIEPSDEMQLLKIHLAMINQDEMLASQMLSAYEQRLEELRESAPVLYCGVYYLRALQYKDEANIVMSCEAIREIYQEGHTDFMIFWFLIYLDKHYLGQKKLLLEDLYLKFQDGCTSPMLYYEAAHIYLSEPGLLHGLGDFERQVMRFAFKHNMFNEEIANHYAYLASKERYYSRLVFNTLEKLYAKYESKDLLTAICSMLIKGHLRSNRYFRWFKLGVEAQLRVTELHEYYMYAIDERLEEELPQQILLYFIYNSSLNDKKRAYLYARIVKNKQSNGSIYRTYARKIEQFAKKQLESGAISENLAVLYQDLVDEDQVTEELYPALAKIAYKAEIFCPNPRIKGVAVSWCALKGEEYVPLQEQVALVNLYSKDALISLVGENEERYVATVEYEVRYILRQDDKLAALMQWARQSLYQQLEHIAFDGAYMRFNENAEQICKQCLELTEVRKDFRNRILTQLIYYCNEHQQTDALEYYLRSLDIQSLNLPDRNKILEICINQEAYDLAWQIIDQYGYEHIGIGKLLQLFLRCLAEQTMPDQVVSEQIAVGQSDATCHATNSICPQVSERLLGQISNYLFLKGRRDPELLAYLVKHYEGPTQTLYRIWQSARKDDLQAQRLEEQFLVQAMFAGEELSTKQNVFLSYYRQGGDRRIITAYLNIIAYLALLQNQIIDKELLECMVTELNNSENELYMIAVLKHASNHVEEITNEEEPVLAQLLSMAVVRNLVLPCFKNLSAKIELPNTMKNKQYIEYQTKPDTRVTLSYRLIGKNLPQSEFTSELLTPMMAGIYTRSFLLFYGESFEYYFTEEIGDEVIRTSPTLLPWRGMDGKATSNYSKINEMLRLYEEQKIDELSNKIENYVKEDYIRNHYFKNL